VNATKRECFTVTRKALAALFFVMLLVGMTASLVFAQGNNLVVDGQSVAYGSTITLDSITMVTFNFHTDNLDIIPEGGLTLRIDWYVGYIGGIGVTEGHKDVPMITVGTGHTQAAMINLKGGYEGVGDIIKYGIQVVDIIDEGRRHIYYRIYIVTEDMGNGDGFNGDFDFDFNGDDNGNGDGNGYTVPTQVLPYVVIIAASVGVVWFLTRQRKRR